MADQIVAVTKKCSSCREHKDIESFHRHAGSVDGHQGVCKACGTMRMREYRKANPEKIRAISKVCYEKWRNENPGRVKPGAKEASKRWRDAHPEEQAAAQKQWRKNNSEAARALSLKWSRAHPKKVNAAVKAYRKANPEKVKAQGRAWIKKNPERAKANAKVRHARLLAAHPGIAAQYAKRWRDKNPEVVKENGRKWSKKNAEHCARKSSERRAATFRAIPPWLTVEDRALIAAKFAEAKRISLETNVKHHVDHIVPLKGEKVRGLHVPWNLQVIPASVNHKKWNKIGAEQYA